MFQLNARISDESNKQLESIVEYYRTQIPVGRVSKGAVLEDVIKKSYEQLLKHGKVQKIES